MRRKKLLTAAIATALVAAQVVMPVAAADGGSVHVDVTTKTAVLQVIVPTKLSVAVDPMEMSNSGTQIYSETFSIVNQSEVPVRVDITSTVTLKDDSMRLLSKKSDVSGASAAAGQVWMGVAAQTSDGKFIEEAGKGIGDLTEASANVTTFTQKMTGEGEDAALDKEGEAAQVFYLKAATGNTDFKLLNANEAVKKELTYTQYRELEAKTVADATELNKLLADNDVYVAAAAAADGQTLTKVEKGGTHTWSGTEVYYITDGNVVGAETIADTHSELYVYGGRATADATDGKAAFRYIGALSTAQVAWSNEDITDVDIVYSIVGVKGSDYDAMKTKGDITYGLYAPVPTTITGVKITDASGTKTYSTAAALATQIKSYGVAFVVGEDDPDLSGLTASKIVIDGKEYEFTTSDASAANSDKKAYKPSGFTAASASKIEVHYGADYVIKYTLS